MNRQRPEPDLPPAARSANALEGIFAILNDCYDFDSHALRTVDAATNPAPANDSEKRGFLARIFGKTGV